MPASPQRIGRYEIRRPLGQGAMGIVYEALDPLIERVVAIKTISLNFSNEERESFQSRFFREAKSAGRLNHPNIVTVYDVGEANDVAYIAMEFLTGQTLRDWLDSGVVLPMSSVRNIASKLAQALDYAHENGVVHRDIKPANIMVAADQSVKLMDFGIAQLPTGSQTIHGTVLGSPKYMAPEQIAGRAVDGRSDVFSLGVVLYELLTGQVPFNAESLSSIMYKIVHEEALPPSKMNGRVPAAFDAIVARALAKDPQARFQRAADFAAALAAIDAGSVTNASATVGSAISATATLQSHDHDATMILSPLDATATASAAAAFAAAASARGDTSLAADDAPKPAPRDSSRLRLWLLQGGFLIGIIAIFLWAGIDSPGNTPGNSAADSASARASENTVLPAPAAKETAPNIDPASPIAPVAPASTALPAADAALNSAIVAAPTKSQATTQTHAKVSLAVYPWGEIWVNGKNVGVSPPLNELKLPAGRHTVEIRNESRPPYRETLTVEAGDTSKKIRHKFQ